jgi:hypothetical protein
MGLKASARILDFFSDKNVRLTIEDPDHAALRTLDLTLNNAQLSYESPDDSSLKSIRAGRMRAKVKKYDLNQGLQMLSMECLYSIELDNM